MKLLAHAVLFCAALFCIGSRTYADESSPVIYTFYTLKEGKSTAEVRHEDPTKLTRVELRGYTAAVVDQETGKTLFEIEKFKHNVIKIELWSYNYSGSKIAVGGGYKSGAKGEGTNVGAYSVWDVKTGKKIQESPQGTGSIKAIGFSDSDQVIYHAEDYDYSGK